MIKLGDKVEDRFSSFKGTAIQRVTFLNRCRRYNVIADKLKEGESKHEWIDEIHLDPNPPKLTETPYPLGESVKDSITGFSGIATSVMEVLNGNVRILITSKTKTDRDSQPLELWFDVERLGKKVADKVFEGLGEIPTGGPASSPKHVVPKSSFKM